MPAIPMKPEYGPTLGELLAPRWHAAGRGVRAVAIAAGVGLAVLAIGIALTLLNATYSHRGRVPFSFSYRGLWKARPDPGGYVKVQRRGARGTLRDSFAVAPLRLPLYRGGLSGEMPLFAAGYIRALARRDRGFVLRGEGKTNVNKVLRGYDVFYTAVVEGREMYGRDVLLVPERPGAREGVALTMLTSPTASKEIKAPVEVATVGILLRPLKTFSFG